MADKTFIKNTVEAALLAAGKPLDLDHIQTLFDEEEQPEKKLLREVLTELSGDYDGRGIEVTEVASGWRIQVRSDFAKPVSRLWEEKPARYSRALMETLALIAYRQPITRGEIEDIRGVSVSSNITKTLLEREWIRVVGQRDVPGKPSLYGTTRTFLDYFNLKSLDELPTLAEIRDLDEINRALDLDDPDKAAGAANDGDADAPTVSADGAEVVQLATAAAAVEGDAADPDDVAIDQAITEAVDSDAGEDIADAPVDADLDEEGDFDDILPEFESDWDEGLDEDTTVTEATESRWADQLAEELEEELVQSELQQVEADKKS